MSFCQLDPALPVFVIDKGRGLAIGVIDYGPEHNLIWVTAIDATGEIWCAPNPLVRMQENWSAGRPRSAAESEARAKCGNTGPDHSNGAPATAAAAIPKIAVEVG